MSPKRKPSGKKDLTEAAFLEAVDSLKRHRLFGPLIIASYIVRSKEESLCPPNGWTMTVSDGDTYTYTQLATPSPSSGSMF